MLTLSVAHGKPLTPTVRRQVVNRNILPIHITLLTQGAEECAELGGRAVLKQVHPPGILRTGGHVVGNDVEQKAHAASLQSAE